MWFFLFFGGFLLDGLGNLRDNVVCWITNSWIYLRIKGVLQGQKNIRHTAE